MRRVPAFARIAVTLDVNTEPLKAAQNRRLKDVANLLTLLLPDIKAKLKGLTHVN